MRFWLLKSEAKDFSWQDLLASPLQTTDWSGVRNFTARKHLGMMQQGDLAFFIILVFVTLQLSALLKLYAQPIPMKKNG